MASVTNGLHQRHLPVQHNPESPPHCRGRSGYNRLLPKFHHQALHLAHHPPPTTLCSVSRKHRDLHHLLPRSTFLRVYQHHASLQAPTTQVTILKALVIVEWEIFDTSTPHHRRLLTVSLLKHEVTWMYTDIFSLIEIHICSGNQL